MEERTLKKVSIRLIDDRELLTDERLDSPLKAAKVAGEYIRHLDREALCVVNFNSKLQPLNCCIVSVGTVNQTLALPRDIYKSSILSNASYTMVIHNHPSGTLEPSKDDIKVTSRLIGAGDVLGIPLLDHIIVNPDNELYFSMKERDTLQFNKSIAYEDRLEFLNFKSDEDTKVAERENVKVR